MINSPTLKNQIFNWGTRTYIMGILNVTPDSFSDGGDYHVFDSAIQRTLTMIDQGADIIDIGGQSTRPGAKQITLAEELERVIPVIRSIRQKTDITISVDTTRAKVAQEAIEAGANIVNDISGGTFDDQMFPIVANMKVPIILMHIRGNPETMQGLTNYQDVVIEIQNFLEQRIKIALQLGIKKEHIIIDPGIGFAKNYEQNITLLRNISQFKKMGYPVLIGTSRKSFIGQILHQSQPKERIWGTAGSCSYAITQGADILRVHDVDVINDVARVTDAICRIEQ